MNESPMAVIREQVEQAGGVKMFELGDLRDAVGHQNLGTDVLKKIDRQVADVGLAYWPEAAKPLRAKQEVRVYVRNSRVGQIVDAVMSPSETGDQLLNDLAAGEAAAKIEAIREVLANRPSA